MGDDVVWDEKAHVLAHKATPNGLRDDLVCRIGGPRMATAAPPLADVLADARGRMLRLYREFGVRIG
jgi:hypothetical protein